MTDFNPVFDIFDDLVFTFDNEGTFLEWNQATVDVTGYTEDELATMTPTDFFEGEDAYRVREAVADIFETGEATVEAEVVTADGDRIPYEFKAHRLPDSYDGAPAFAGIGRDITDRKQAQRERRDILNRMGDGFLAVDREWTVTFVNDVGKEVLSRAADQNLRGDELEGVDLWEGIPDAVETTFYEKYHEAMETQQPVTFEEYYAPLDKWFDVRAYPSETGLSIYFQDITERRRQRESLETRERVLHEMHDIIADRERPFTDQVEALLHLGRTQLDTEYGSLSRIEGEEYVFEVVDSDADELQAGDVVPLSATTCERAASTEQTLVLGDVERDAPEETDRAGYTDWGICCYIGGPVFVDDEVYGTLCFYGTDARDDQFSEWEITLVELMNRWVSYELQRQEAQDKLRRQNEKLERFASVVSHDLRNPLSVMEGAVVLTEETGDLEKLSDAHRAIDRMNALIDELLLLARSGSVVDDVEAVDLASVVEGCWKNVTTEEATLRVDTTRTIYADTSRLQQLLENLIANAVEHGGDAVTVTVGDLTDGFYVEDDGPGIGEDDRESVFESGYTTGSDGTGIGLAIVEEIAEAHGWEVGLTSGSDGGARFEFTGTDAA